MDAIKEVVSTLIAPGALLTIIIYASVLYRSGSSHMLLARIWSLAAGGATTADQDIKSYGDDLHSLSYFQFSSGLHVSSLSQAKKAIAWSRERDIDLRHVARCGRYFDLENWRIKIEVLPKRWLRSGAVVFLWLILALSTGLLAFVHSSQDVFLIFRESRTHFSLSQHEARRWRYDYPLTLTECRVRPNNIKQAGTGFTPAEAIGICALLQSVDAKQKIDGMLDSQRKDAWLIYGLVLALLAPLAIWVVRIFSSLVLAKLLDQKQQGAIQEKISPQKMVRKLTISARRTLFLARVGRGK